MHWPGDSDSLETTYGITVGVRSAVMLVPSAARVPVGGVVRPRAYVHPADARGWVLFQRLVGRRWINVSRSRLFSSGVAGGAVRLTRRGLNVLRAVHGRSATNLSGTSPPGVVTAL